MLKRELSEWLVCDGLATNDIKFEIDNVQSPVYESGICRYGQYSPSEKKITLFIKNILDEKEYEYHSSLMNYPESIKNIIKNDLDYLLKMIEKKEGPFNTTLINDYIIKYFGLFEK